MSESMHETGEITCPRCGDPAGWRSSNSDGTHVEVDCPACGCFSMTVLQPVYAQLGLEPGVRTRRSPDSANPQDA